MPHPAAHADKMNAVMPRVRNRDKRVEQTRFSSASYISPSFHYRSGGVSRRIWPRSATSAQAP